MNTPTARFLRGLPANGFAPPPADVEAVGIPDLPRTADAQVVAFAAEVAAFAGEYWSLEPPIRRKRWRALADRAVGPATAWLAELEAGLGVVPAPQPDTLAKEVAGLVRELVTLPPAARAARRLAWLTAPGRRDPGWVAAVRTVLRTDLLLARLEPRLFDWYSLGAVPAPVPADPNAPTLLTDRLTPPLSPDPPSQVVPFADGDRVFPGGCGGGLAAMAVVGFLRLLVVLFSSPSEPAATPPRPPANQWQAPAPAPPASPPEGGLVPFDAPFTPAEVKQFREYEQQIQAQGRHPPYTTSGRYGRWVAFGRPNPSSQP